MADQMQVSVGQIWEDYDSRYRMFDNRRRLRVLKTNARRTLVEDVNGSRQGRQTWILTRRLRPTSTGYRLISDSRAVQTNETSTTV